MKTLNDLIIKDGKKISGYPNYLKIHVSQLDQSNESVKKFNDIYNLLLKSKIPKIKWTKSGGLSLVGSDKYSDMWGVKISSWLVEITLVIWVGSSRFGCRWQFGRGEIKLKEDEELKYSGRRALFKAKEDAKDLGIDLESLAIPNGEEVKKSIPSPIIWVDDRMMFKTFEKAHHIDFRSSHCAGAINSFPILEPMIRKWYNLRKTNEIYKAQLVMFWGAMQSPKLCQARWANISKAGIEWTNKNVLSMKKRLEDSGRKVICINTDGLWYLGDVFHGEGEGDDIGDWHNDHVDCQIRFKSRGCYEYIENGIYTPVLRGKTNLDNLKPRSKWVWGDIFDYQATPNFFEFVEGQGIVIISEERRKKIMEEEDLLNKIKNKHLNKK